ncbi:hypothetical protein ALC53_00889 [Atta colombica]|uniref:Uncharacterized protein n=1 Tax=Atta colombica TaxID=520822 RepID=A0A195BUY5_9HYME|nr:hypothetical protein ALC53_00889 [Atta colombica]
MAIKAERDEHFSPKPPVVSLQEERGIPALPVCLMKFRSLTGRSNALSLRGQEAFPKKEFLTLEQQQRQQQQQPQPTTIAKDARKCRRRPVRSRTRGYIFVILYNTEEKNCIPFLERKNPEEDKAIRPADLIDRPQLRELNKID